ncbi:MAG: hypothetical protein IJ092_08305 [Atopobiaceae bacterium]|nr:hypothetical protein [Atopobiaceae bacterium]
MLHRDYLLEVIAQFVDTVIQSLTIAREKADPKAAQDVEAAVAGLLDLDQQVAMQLTPDSLVTMLLLSGVGDALADYVTYAMRELADAYDGMGEHDLASLRREQAHAVADSFGCDYDVVPEEFA